MSHPLGLDSSGSLFQEGEIREEATAAETSPRPASGFPVTGPEGVKGREWAWGGDMAGPGAEAPRLAGAGRAPPEAPAQPNFAGKLPPAALLQHLGPRGKIEEPPPAFL